MDTFDWLVPRFDLPQTSETIEDWFDESSLINIEVLQPKHLTIRTRNTRSKKMKTIVIEALSSLQGGGQTYLKNLFQHYPVYPDVRVVALVPRKLAKELPKFHSLEIITSDFASKSVMHRILWNKFALPKLLRKLKASVLYSTGGSLATNSIENCRTVVAFRNMLPFAPTERKRYPFGYMRLRLWLLRFIQGASFCDADLVIFISMFAKSVINLSLPNRQGQSICIPHGLSEHFFRSQVRPTTPKLPQDYVLYVSILDVYKSQVEVIKAWAELRLRRKTHEKLLLVGPEFKHYGNLVRRTISELKLENEVLIFGSVPYVELPAYYQHAKVNIFASSCENCPNIFLEALAGGRPILCSDYQPMPEFGQTAVTYFDPHNPQRLADKLVTMLDDLELQAEMGRRALERAQDFNWRVSARRTWDALCSEAYKVN